MTPPPEGKKNMNEENAKCRVCGASFERSMEPERRYVSCPAHSFGEVVGATPSEISAEGKKEFMELEQRLMQDEEIGDNVKEYERKKFILSQEVKMLKSVKEWSERMGEDRHGFDLEVMSRDRYYGGVPTTVKIERSREQKDILSSLQSFLREEIKKIEQP